MNDIYSAKYSEWLASIFGATFAAFGLGVLLSDYFRSFALLILIVGILLHSWGMYKTHGRNKN